jgi:hypothetical protein
MARPKARAVGNNLESRTSEETVQSKGIHIPNWMMWTAAGTALLAAGYLGVRYNVLPNPFAREQTTEQRPSENAVPGGSIDVTVEPGVTEHTVTLPSDPLASIRVHEPDLAAIIEKQEWFSDNISNPESRFLDRIGNVVAEGLSFYPASLVIDGVERQIVLLYDSDIEFSFYDPDLNRAVTSQGPDIVIDYFSRYIEAMYDFTKVSPTWSFLNIKIIRSDDKLFGGASTVSDDISEVFIETSDGEISYASRHETGHLMSSTSDTDFNAIWYSEGLAELLNSSTFGTEHLEQTTHPRLLEKYGDPNGFKPLNDYDIDDHLGRSEVRGNEVVDRGALFLLDLRELVGTQAFQDSLRAVYEASLLTREMTSEAVEKAFINNSPIEFHIAIGDMFNTVVYGN